MVGQRHLGRAILERLREKVNGRDEDVAEEEEDAVACDCALDTISKKSRDQNRRRNRSNAGSRRRRSFGRSGFAKILDKSVPRVLFLPHFVTKERASSSCSTPFAVLFSVSQGAR